MMWAPFLNYSDDQLQQLAQFQIFLTLVASIGLRMTPPSYTLATMMTVLLMCIPFIGLGLETPIVSVVLGEGGSGGALGLAMGNKIAMLSQVSACPQRDRPYAPWWGLGSD